MKKKVKKPKWYNIFIVPEGRPASHGIKVPWWAHKAVAIFAIVWLAATFLLIEATVYYRNGWLSTESIRISNEEIRTKENVINNKIASMEQVVQHVDRLAGRLETAIGINKKVMRKGIGPIPDDDPLPSPKKLNLSNNYKLGDDSAKEGTVAFNDLELQVDELNETISSVEMRLQEVYEFHQDKLSYWASIPSIWPVKGWVTSEFGIRRSPRGIGSRFHEGIDIRAPIGTPVYASGDGVVTFAGYKHGLGKTIIVDHGFGVTTVYGHNSQLLVSEGEKVKRGMNISAVGSTGRSTGPHLHYQVVVDGVPVDPMRYIIENF